MKNQLAQGGLMLFLTKWNKFMFTFNFYRRNEISVIVLIMHDGNIHKIRIKLKKYKFEKYFYEFP